MSEWSLVVTEYDGTAVHTFDQGDAADDGPILAVRGQDVRNDTGQLFITLPAEHMANGYLAEDRLVHLHVRGTYVATWMVRSADATIIDKRGAANQVAEWRCDHLSVVATEGIVEPAGAIGTKPASQDVRWDWTHPERDNSDFTTPDELGTVTDAQTNYTVTPYGIGQDGGGFVYPGITKVIGPAGYGWTDDAPAGRCYFYKDVDFGSGATVVVNSVGDNGCETMLANQTIIRFTIGFGTSSSWGKQVVSGVQRVAAVVENGGGGGGAGPCTLALEIVEVDPGDNPIGLIDSTDASWGIMEFPAEPPGFTVGTIVRQCLTDEVALGYMVDVHDDFTGTNDSAGAAWSNTWDIGTKALTGLEVFWPKEMGETYADFDTVWAGGFITQQAWRKGHTDGVLTVTRDNLRSFRYPTEPALATSFCSLFNDGGDVGYRNNEVAPETGKRPRRRGLAQGASKSIEQTDRDALGQLGYFGRMRSRPEIEIITSADTPDADLPPNWWKWSTLTLTVGSRWVEDGTFDIIAVSFELNANGELVFVPELGDDIIPPPSRPANVLRKMTTPTVGGRSKIVTPVDMQPGTASVNRLGSAGS